MAEFGVVVGAGTLRSAAAGAVSFPHRWTAEGVTVDAAFTGAHLLHLAVAGCVLNDVYREALELGIEIGGVRVSATGDFEAGTWSSTGIGYEVEVDTTAVAVELDALLKRVDDVAEIPKSIRAGASVARRRSRRSIPPSAGSERGWPATTVRPRPDRNGRGTDEMS
ncbi:MAG TPA: OsmC family protein, partial [Microlunatus sp.]|nr:OsmC family protein [Microlunatus sp.]